MAMRRCRRPVVLVLGCCLVGLSACSDDPEAVVCDAARVGTAEGCAEGDVCEAVVGGEPACFLPYYLRGSVFDLSDDGAIEAATVVALDANGGARSTVARSTVAGSYQLPLAVPRSADGTPIQEFVTLRVAASGYDVFPKAPRLALPLDLATAQKSAEGWVLQSAQTDVGLIMLASGERNVISGSILKDRIADGDVGGALIVAEVGGVAVSTAISDSGGNFVLFNVPSGSVELKGYRAGLGVTPRTIEVSSALVEDVRLAASPQNLTTVSGSVQIVNAPGGSRTSVLLVVKSTFDEASKRGESPAGLRVGDVTSAFTIEAVPPGRYVVLAAFENDKLVRDPDQTIGGTAIVEIEVSGGTHAISAGFKVTEALAIQSPGASGLETINTMTPTFRWTDDSSEDGYELQVFDALGNLVDEQLDLPGTSGTDPSHTLSGVTLKPGMIYQFRVKSFRDKQGNRTYISATEDLRGLFQYLPTTR